jgi:hypothetical protein
VGCTSGCCSSPCFAAERVELALFLQVFHLLPPSHHPSTAAVWLICVCRPEYECTVFLTILLGIYRWYTRVAPKSCRRRQRPRTPQLVAEQEQRLADQRNDVLFW